MELFYKILRNAKPLGKYMARILSVNDIKRRVRFIAHTYSMGGMKGQELEILLGELKRRRVFLDPSLSWCQETLARAKGADVTKNEQSVLSTEGAAKDHCGKELFLDLCNKRSSVRNWQNKPIEEDAVNYLISCAIQAPSSCNRQSLRFLIVKNKNDIAFFSEERKLNFINGASLLIVVLVDKSLYLLREQDYTPFLDASAGIQSILLGAEALQIGACWINMGKCEISRGSSSSIFKRFDIPKELLLVALIALGYPAGTPSKPKRDSINEYIL